MFIFLLSSSYENWKWNTEISVWDFEFEVLPILPITEEEVGKNKKSILLENYSQNISTSKKGFHLCVIIWLALNVQIKKT